MSSRYGRNQRRRAREEIAQLRQDRAWLNEQVNEQSAEIRDLHRRMGRWASSIRQMLGPDHPFNEELRVRVMKSLNMRPMTVRACLPDRIEDLSLIESMSSCSEIAMTTLDLICHYLLVRKFEPTGMPRTVIRLRSGDGVESAYAIDEIALMEGRRDPRFIEWIAEELVRQINRPEAKAA